jgi:hypothetical protein
VNVCPRPGVAAEDLGELARVLLRAVAIGAPSAELANALARGAIESAGLGLALEVLARGPFSTVRAIELAELLLAMEGAPAGINTAADGA